MQTDIHGREIKAGDLLKIYHYTAARRRRKIYVYRLVCRVNKKKQIDKNGSELYIVAVADIYHSGSLNKAYKVPLSFVKECEIIDGGTVHDGDLFWERKRVINQ